MTRTAAHSQHAVALHFEPESFVDAAHGELTLAPPWAWGVCFNPSCGRRFDPARRWQVYCCGACQASGKIEMRKWGNKMALPLLIHRIGKYERRDVAVMDVTRAARRYVTQVQSAWLQDRLKRQGACG
jgi:hypothetical protein